MTNESNSKAQPESDSTAPLVRQGPDELLDGAGPEVRRPHPDDVPPVEDIIAALDHAVALGAPIERAEELAAMEFYLRSEEVDRSRFRLSPALRMGDVSRAHRITKRLSAQNLVFPYTIEGNTRLRMARPDRVNPGFWEGLQNIAQEILHLFPNFCKYYEKQLTTLKLNTLKRAIWQAIKGEESDETLRRIFDAVVAVRVGSSAPAAG